MTVILIVSIMMQSALLIAVLLCASRLKRISRQIETFGEDRVYRPADNDDTLPIHSQAAQSPEQR
jgi:hypothetical protein